MTTDSSAAENKEALGLTAARFRSALGTQFDGRSREGCFLRKVHLGLLAQLGREPSFAELMPAGIQQKVTETHAA